MCIRDRADVDAAEQAQNGPAPHPQRERREAQKADDQGPGDCLLYTSDAADERSSVDLGGRRIITKKKTQDH